MITQDSSDTILKALDFSELEEDQQEELLLDLNTLIFKGSLVRLIERMDDATRDSFTALMDTDPTEDQVDAFLGEHVPDADLAVQETLDELTGDILAITGPVTK